MTFVEAMLRASLEIISTHKKAHKEIRGIAECALRTAEGMEDNMTDYDEKYPPQEVWFVITGDVLGEHEILRILGTKHDAQKFIDGLKVEQFTMRVVKGGGDES